MLGTIDTTNSTKDHIDPTTHSAKNKQRVTPGSVSHLITPEPKPKRSPTEATRRSAQEARTLNHLLTAAGFKGGIRAFIIAVWAVSRGVDVFSACHAQVGTHGHDNRSEAAARAYVRYWLEQLEKVQAQLGVFFIRFTRGKIDPETGEHISTNYDCSVLYDAINAMAAREPHHKASVWAQRIVDQLRVEPVLVEENDDTADDTALMGEPIKVLKAMAVKRGWLVKAARLAGDDPAEWLRKEIAQAQKVLARLEGERIPTLKINHREGREGENSDTPLFAKNDEIGPSLLGERVRKSDPLPALADLQNFTQWVAWYYRKRTSKKGEITLTKPPLNPHTDGHADVQNPATWGTYDEAVACGGTKVGFVMTDSDPFAGIDIDHCIDEKGEIEDWALGIIEMMNSYSERSPSKRGVRIFVRGVLPGEGLNRLLDGHKIEVYDRARYLTFTGDHIDGTPQTIESRHATLTALYNKIARVQEAPNPQKKPKSPSSPSPSCDHSVLADEHLTEADNALIDRLSTWGNKAKFLRLYGGDASEYGSPSQADAGLCCMVAFATKDNAQVRRIVRNSKLRDESDEKRNRADYWERTIANARKKVAESKGKLARAGTQLAP